jgi:hypothetical protein
MDYKLLTWDWKESVDIDELARVVYEMSNGSVHIRSVETDSDFFAVIVSKEKVNDALANMILVESYEDDD